MGFDFIEAYRERNTIFVKKEYWLEVNTATNIAFKIYSDVSTNEYVIQKTFTGKWTCSCPAFKNNQQCKHLVRLGLPDDNVEIKIVE